MADRNVEPRAREMESAILGRLMVDSSAQLLQQVREKLTQDDFLPTHKRIFKHICKLADEGKPWDWIAAQQSLTDAGDLEYIGGPAALSKMTTDVARGTDLAPAIEMVRDATDRRRLIRFSNSQINAAITGEKSAPKLRSELQNWLSRYESQDSDAGLLKEICMSDVEAQETEWLAYPYLPIGKVTMLEGDPGIGKSHVSLAFAAGVAAGFGLPGQKERTEPRAVLIASVEDGLADTIRPRLDRMNAHVERIFAIDEPFTFDQKGLLLLEATIAHVSAVLVIVDPIQGFVGSGVDIHRTNETRPIMARLAEIADRQRCAILCIRHLTKTTGGKAIYRGIGSIDFSAAVRSILLAGCDPDDPSKRAVVQTKNNLAVFAEPFGYVIDEDGFHWTGKSDLTDDKILGARSGDREQEKQSAVQEAVEFLMSQLKDGPVESERLKKEAKQAGIAWATLRRAKTQLRIKPRPSKQNGGQFDSWQWELPHTHEQVEQVEHVEKTHNDNSNKVIEIVVSSPVAQPLAQSSDPEHSEHVDEHVDDLTLSSSNKKPYRNGITPVAQGAQLAQRVRPAGPLTSLGVAFKKEADDDLGWESSDEANT